MELPPAPAAGVPATGAVTAGVAAAAEAAEAGAGVLQEAFGMLNTNMLTVSLIQDHKPSPG